HIIRMLETMPAQDVTDICGGSMDEDQPRIMDGAFEMADEVAVGIDGNQSRIGVKAIENRPCEGADARPIFDKNACSFPIDSREHLIDELVRRGDDRTDHCGVLAKFPEEQGKRDVVHSRKTELAAALERGLAR